MVRVPFGSGYVKAFHFFIAVLGMWAIHRGLVDLQAHCHFRAALNSSEIPIKRSRIPVVSGELLAGRTRFPSCFVLAHVVVIALAFYSRVTPRRNGDGSRAPISPRFLRKIYPWSSV